MAGPESAAQLDGLGHIGIDNLYYNCNRGIDFALTDGLKKLGIENVPAIATRGVCSTCPGTSIATSSRKAPHSIAPRSKAR